MATGLVDGISQRQGERLHERILVRAQLSCRDRWGEGMIETINPGGSVSGPILALHFWGNGWCIRWQWSSAYRKEFSKVLSHMISPGTLPGCQHPQPILHCSQQAACVRGHWNAKTLKDIGKTDPDACACNTEGRNCTIDCNGLGIGYTSNSGNEHRLASDHLVDNGQRQSNRGQVCLKRECGG